MIETSVTRYHPVAVALHWLLGLALIGNFALGLYMADLPFSPARLQYYSWHKWAGVLVLTFSLFRLLTRWLARPPALPKAIEAAMPVWQRLAHQATHHGLYLLFFAVPLLGWAYSSAAGFPLVLFGVLPLPDFVPVSEGLAEALKPLHKFSAFAMAALVLLHVAGALKHRIVDRDGLLQRMAFGRG
ncbi:cytochrome b [Hydrogenophaga sp.]|jgi:cytochrome b561|uniref:cytochrome b n=1 Tax=Hydrogenophaga sp. TaxID=1904254 RepID=UPI002724E628|nr:cytochrome b [Hydrogenophaga sp.]MDO9250311.1 cytochrome b [Hydrogenophaga sp.]MDP3325962.1 cytochrome b [Hydrogenophaga sp.]MDP3883724.1 cytochrome b [Hydrogenophaga sp.]MDZ4355062.1 cytochrome b [Variovorax sp.]